MKEGIIPIMMQQLRNPKNVKVISLFIAAIFVLGVFALSMTQSGFGKSAMAGTEESAIGVVNSQMLYAQSAEIKKVGETMQEEAQKAQKDFEEKSKDLSEAEKRDMYQKAREQLDAKQKELLEPVQKHIEEEIKKVADKKGLVVVVEKNTVVYGGLDITDEVAKELQKEK